MPNYQNGKMYSIRSHLTDDVYIGSTVETLSNRLSQHKKYYKKWLITKKNSCSSYKIIEKDLECYIELVELYPCNSKIELERREGEIIRATTCVNKRIAGRTLKEYYKDNKQQIAEKLKQYREDNKEKIAEYKKQYRQTNKEKLAEKDKIKYNNNKEKITEYHKQYYQNNKEKKTEQNKKYRENHKAEISEREKQKYTCECGSTLTIKKKQRHERTKKHQTFINSN